MFPQPKAQNKKPLRKKLKQKKVEVEIENVDAIDNNKSTVEKKDNA